MLLPSPEATEELRMNPFRAARHPARLPEQFQHQPFHRGDTGGLPPKRTSEQSLCAARALMGTGVDLNSEFALLCNTPYTLPNPSDL